MWAAAELSTRRREKGRGVTDSRDNQRPMSDEPDLAALDILDDVPPDLYRGAQRREARAGQVLMASGAAAAELLILVRGSVAVSEDGVRIATRKPERLLGELAFIDDKPRSATVLADEAVVYWAIPGADVPALLADAAFARNLNRELSWKLREATADRSWRYRAEELLFGAFGAHASPELLQELLRTGKDGTPQRTDVVTLFADIRGFTRHVLTMTPEDLTADLERFLDVAVTVVHRHGGMVDKFVGDEVMALWGYAAQPDDAARALACAVDLVRETSALRLAGDPIRIGVGLESGTVTLGVVGNDEKRQFTAIGPSVNLAARLQGATKDLGSPICIGPGLAARLADDTLAGLDGPISHDIRGAGPTQVWTLDPKE